MANLPGSENGFTIMRYNGADVSTTTWRDPVSGYNYSFSARRRPTFAADSGDVERLLSHRLPNGSPMFSIVEAEEKSEPSVPVAAPAEKEKGHVSERLDRATEAAWSRLEEYAIPIENVTATGVKSTLGGDYNRVTLDDVEKYIEEKLSPLVEERVTAQAVTEAEKLGVDVRVLLHRYNEEEVTGKIGIRHVREYHEAIEKALSDDPE